MSAISRRKIIRGDLAQWDGRNFTVSSPDASGGTITGIPIGNEVDILSVYSSDNSRTDGTINVAVNRLGSTACTIVFAPGTWSIDADVTIPSNIVAHIPAGVIFDVASGKTLTFNGPILVEYAAQWYSGSGIVTVTQTAYTEAGDVRIFGAKGDGTTDDTTALINAGKSSKNVYIDPSLTCRVTGTLSTGIQSGQRWWGGGAITTANGFNFTVFACSGKTDVTFDGLVLTSGTLGVAYGSADARAFQFASSSHRGRVINCKVTGFQQAVRVHTSTDCKIVNNDIITPYGWGVSVQTDADYCLVDGNRISGCVNEHGIYISGSNANNIIATKVIGNTVSGSALDGIKLTYCDDALIANNTTTANGHEGIYVTIGTNRADVHDNHVYANLNNGIIAYTATASDTLDRNHIHHNTVYLNQYDGIRVLVGNASATISNTIISDNICHDNNQAAGSYRGISLGHTAGTHSGSQVLRNFVTSETTGINIAANCTGVVIRDNTFDANTTNISDSSTGAVIDQVTRGATSVADGGTITHGHPKTPTGAIVTCSTADEWAAVSAISATTITVQLTKHDNSAGTTAVVYWQVWG